MDECLHSGSKVQLYLRGRGEPIHIIRVNKSQFSFRVYTQSGEFFDLAYSAVEGAKYKRTATMDISDI